jgi:hypothetical protein
MFTQNPQTKYSNSVSEPYRTVLVNYLTSHKSEIVGTTASTESPLENKVFTMIIHDFSPDSPIRKEEVFLVANNVAQIYAMAEEKGYDMACLDEKCIGEWIKKNSDKFRRGEGELIASLFERDIGYFLEVLDKAA